MQSSVNNASNDPPWPLRSSYRELLKSPLEARCYAGAFRFRFRAEGDTPIAGEKDVQTTAEVSVARNPKLIAASQRLQSGLGALTQSVCPLGTRHKRYEWR
jgi:hypothetical protein